MPRSIARIRSAFRPSAVLQALAVKALNDLPAKHGKRPTSKTLYWTIVSGPTCPRPRAPFPSPWHDRGTHRERQRQSREAI